MCHQISKIYVEVDHMEITILKSFLSKIKFYAVFCAKKLYAPVLALYKKVL
jgi:hypothetical protein